MGCRRGGLGSDGDEGRLAVRVCADQKGHAGAARSGGTRADRQASELPSPAHSARRQAGAVTSAQRARRQATAGAGRAPPRQCGRAAACTRHAARSNQPGLRHGLGPALGPLASGSWLAGRQAGARRVPRPSRPSPLTRRPTLPTAARRHNLLLRCPSCPSCGPSLAWPPPAQPPRRAPIIRREPAPLPLRRFTIIHPSCHQPPHPVVPCLRLFPRSHARRRPCRAQILEPPALPPTGRVTVSSQQLAVLRRLAQPPSPPPVPLPQPHLLCLSPLAVHGLRPPAPSRHIASHKASAPAPCAVSDCLWPATSTCAHPYPSDTETGSLFFRCTRAPAYHRPSPFPTHLRPRLPSLPLPSAAWPLPPMCPAQP